MPTETDLERWAPQLGAGAAEQVDAERVAAAVLRRLAEAARPAPWWRRIGLAPALAAAAALVMAVGLGIGDRSERAGSEWLEGPLPVVFGEMAEAELAEVLDSLDYHAPVADLVPAGIDDLSLPELQALLEALEG